MGGATISKQTEAPDVTEGAKQRVGINSESENKICVTPLGLESTFFFLDLSEKCKTEEAWFIIPPSLCSLFLFILTSVNEEE